MIPVAVIVAAGNGTRMKSEVPKQFMSLAGKPVLLHTADAFIDAFPEIKLIVVTHPEHLGTCSALLRKYDAEIVTGASIRSGSVMAGLARVPDECIVFVHDAVRCLVSPALIRRCYHAALQFGNAIPAVEPVDSLRMLTATGSRVVDRATMRVVQTPQTFRSQLLRKAYADVADLSFSDDATVAERSGIGIHLVEGEVTNIKLTYPSDILLAESILAAR